MAVDWFGFTYAALVTAGGVTGYLKAGGFTSLSTGDSLSRPEYNAATRRDATKILQQITIEPASVTDLLLRSVASLLGSVSSLAAGLLFGLLAAVGAYRASQNPRNVWLSLGTSGTLAVVMGLRFLNSWKFMPAGLMTVASALLLVKIIIGMLKRPHKS